MMRLDKLLATLGAGTRSELRSVIRKGLVQVNGETVKDPGAKLSGDERVTVDGRDYHFTEFVYYMLNKPAGVITASRDPKQRTVLGLFGEDRRRDLFAVGRLDKDTTGLLIITNDGELDHRLMSPKRHVAKRYAVRVKGELTEDDVRAFAEGLYVDEELTAAPAELTILSRGSISEAEVVIREGKYHQIKRMFAAVGKEVTALRRISVGGLLLDPDLPEGSYRELTEEERLRLEFSPKQKK